MTSDDPQFVKWQPSAENTEREALWEIADGQVKQLDPRWITAEIVEGWIGDAVVAGILLAGILVLWFLDVLPAWGDALCLLAFVVLMAGTVWLTVRWPRWSYARTFYIVSPQGIEIHKGINWRSVTNVPRSRVQHTDVTQGPLMRRYGIAKLTMHTAGTESATVELAGLAHETALRIREFLLAEGDSDAV